MRLRWTFEREAIWMMWLFLLPAVIAMLLMWIVRWLSRVPGD